MPLIIPKTLPAYDALYEENVFVMHRERAASQHIRPLEILILNPNGTERPGAVYLAAVLAAHAQKGLPAFGIYGHDVQDLEDDSIPFSFCNKQEIPLSVPAKIRRLQHT